MSVNPAADSRRFLRRKLRTFRRKVVELDYQWFTLLLAAFVAFNTWWQVWLSAETLKERLFDRRFAVFGAARDFFNDISANADVSPRALARYRIGTVDALFQLDDDNLLEYLDKTIVQKAKRLRFLMLGIQNGAANHMPPDPGAEIADLLGWFDEQYAELRRQFRPHLHFRHRGGRYRKLGI